MKTVWMMSQSIGLMTLTTLLATPGARPTRLVQAPNTWVKRSPLANTPPSPRLGYEDACVWDSHHHVLIRYGGHNQGGGGEQGAEVWSFDPLTAKWTLHEPNTSPPGVCCAAQNVFDPIQGRYLRFPSFSGSHGWQWFREIYLNDSSVWTYDLATNTWRNRRPLPTPSLAPLRCASWDADHQVVVLFGGEGSREGTLVYDPYTNEWTWMKPSVQPAFRSGGNMVYDTAHQLHILFGAQFTDDAHTWAYDLRKNEWRDLKPAQMPPTNQNDAVLTYDPLNKVVLALVKVTEGEGETARHRLETWAYDAGTNQWTKMNPPQEPDPSGNRARQLMFAPELNVAILENRTHPPQGPHEQQIWTYRFAEPKRDASEPPLPPTAVQATTTAESALITWQPSPSPRVARYLIYRGTGEKPWEVSYQQIAVVDARETTYRDVRLRPGTVYFYTLRAADATGRISAESVKVRTQPRVLEEVVVSVLSPREVELSWKASVEKDVVGYHVERAGVEVFSEDQLNRLKSKLPPLPQPSVGAIRLIGPFTRLTRAPVAGTRFTDTTVDLTQPQRVEGEPTYSRRWSEQYLDETGKPYPFAVYAYRVRAVNALGVESGPSPAVLTIPSAPQWVFSKEEGTTCHLKWAENPEKGIQGYRVYRMDGRWEKDPISRLTPDPIRALTYTDPTAGTATRRYYVVAVDALGQEGLPSAPVWFQREWRAFYTPFVGEWHQ